MTDNVVTFRGSERIYFIGVVLITLFVIFGLLDTYWR